MSPQKIREVVRAVKDIESPQKMLETLSFLNRRAARPLSKVVKTAIANAKNNKGIGVDVLRIKEIQIGEGPRMKRWQAGSAGRVQPILKKTSHIKVILEEKESKSTASSLQTTAKKMEETKEEAVDDRPSTVSK
ncbi:50S ribosomal protein L22 [Candidatus Microgenomates bacterium]|nr:50S ribosomal protein L22 [Candidatus Microgenomates bacterium]